MNPFDDPRVVAKYEAWYAGAGRRADILEKRLLLELIADFPLARTALEVGCGTGHFTRWMTQQGLNATGLDISRPMLAEAERLGGATFVEADATQLSFADAHFDLTVMITTLEFVSNPERAMEEAVRVAQRGLILGVLNRHSLLAIRRRASGEQVWRAAHFYAVGELVRMTRRVCGSRLSSLRWKTTLWPVPYVTSMPLPWGGFIGMSVRLSEPRS